METWKIAPPEPTNHLASKKALEEWLVKANAPEDLKQKMLESWELPADES